MVLKKMGKYKKTKSQVMCDEGRFRLSFMMVFFKITTVKLVSLCIP